ncbi:MAG: DUF3396 domain-containing protein [Gemmatimonadaceae bacterium]|jgi:hypothetical protein|nr:DUF3396 domain-containing protein [Gemmatimonadaceae bacterium]
MTLSPSLLKSLTFVQGANGTERPVVRPGITLVLYYGQPMHELAEVVATIVERMRHFIAPTTMTGIRTRTGYTAFTAAGLARQLKLLHDPKREYETLHLISGTRLDAVGSHALHVFGGNLRERGKRGLYPDDTNLVILEFPLAVLETPGPEPFQAFAREVAALAPYVSGYAGYGFCHLHEGTEPLHFIGSRALRVLGFDLSLPDLAHAADRHVVNTSWLNFFGDALVTRLGGKAAIEAQLPPDVVLTSVPHGLLVQAGAGPTPGDVNRKLDVIEPMRAVARVTRALRPSNERPSGRYWIVYGPEAVQTQWFDRLERDSPDGRTP